MMSTTEVELEIEESHEREEGELEDSDVEEGTYIPLQRPEAFNPPSLVNMQIQDECSDDCQSSKESSGSESDDELRKKSKRTKLRPKRPTSCNPDKKNKYNIWCTALQEDLLTEDMVTCDVSKKKDLGVESYDYTVRYRLDDNYVSGKDIFSNNSKNKVEHRNKRTHFDRGNVKHRLGKRINKNYNSEERHRPRILEDLTKTADDVIEELANDIAQKLSEEKADLIGRIVQVVGASKAVALYKETQRIEAEGGMLVMNGTRRRTPGGVYLILLKRDDEVSQVMVNQIFLDDRRETQRRIKRTRAKTRQKVVEQLKQSLTDSELPSLLSRGEATITSTEHGSNPPPSPVTDAKECSSDTDAHAVTPPRPDTRPLNQYSDDDYLEVMCNDDMDFL